MAGDLPLLFFASPSYLQSAKAIHLTHESLYNLFSWESFERELWGGWIFLLSALACTWLWSFLGKSAQPGDGMYQLTWQPSQPWKKQKLIITINWVVASDRRVHCTQSLLPALIQGVFRKEGSGEWTTQIATGAQPTVFIATIFMPTQSSAGSRYWVETENPWAYSRWMGWLHSSCTFGTTI